MNALVKETQSNVQILTVVNLEREGERERVRVYATLQSARLATVNRNLGKGAW